MPMREQLEAHAVSGSTRVLLVEDHAVVREALRMLLSDVRYAIDVVGEAGNGPDAIAAAQALRPDVTLLDLLMPGMDGVEVIGAIVRQNPRARILVLTSDEDPRRALAAIRAGALGFVHKQESTETVIHAIHALALDQAVMPRAVLVHLLAQAGDAPVAAKPVLTAREQSVLACLARGLSNAEIAAELNISTATVRSHVSHLLPKLDAANRTQAVINAAALGLSDG